MMRAAVSRRQAAAPRAAMALLANLALANLALAAPARAQSAGAVQEPARPVLVFAAASLKEALDAAAMAFAASGGVRTRISYAGSNVLALQIERGAPADLFISADRAWMDYLAKRHLLADDSTVDLLANRLVLIAPAGQAPASDAWPPAFDIARRLGTGRLAVADVDSVPAGRYARTALENLGLWPALRDRLARAENVRGALAFVARGETPLGIVYATDAAAEKRVVAVAALPASSYPPVVYPMALLRGSTNATARAFFDYLGSAPARAIFRAHGFSEPDKAAK